ncbi:hypothetical protein TNCV_3834131 [Trichonephila clavipes]|nr:hypothetical protein TNCV_3834131 [Trichonephila clavipes]
MVTYEMLKHICSSDTLSLTQAFEEHRHLRKSVEDDECSGRPRTSCITEKIEKFSVAVLENRLQTTTGENEKQLFCYILFTLLISPRVTSEYFQNVHTAFRVVDSNLQMKS